MIAKQLLDVIINIIFDKVCNLDVLGWSTVLHLIFISIIKEI